jgi:anti-sigma factor RsiW
MRALSLPAGCLSDLVLDEWISGELDAARQGDVQRHLAACVRCAERHAAFSREQDAFLAAAPGFDACAEKAGRTAPPRTRAPRRPMRSLGFGAAALAACAIVLLALRPAGESSARTKGDGPHIGFFVKRGERVSRGQSGQAVQPGDLLRFTYSSDRPRYLALFNRDRHGASVYYPAGASAAQVAPGSGIALGFSVELDDSLGSERIYAVFCPEPFALEPLRAELARAAALQAPAGCGLDVTEIVKEAPR